MKNVLTVHVGEKDFIVELDPKGTVSVDGKDHRIEILKTSRDVMTVTIDGRVVKAAKHGANQDGDGANASTQLVISAGGKDFDVEIDDERSLLIKSFHPKASAGGGLTKVKAPMPGLVVRLEVEKGQAVKPGQGLLVLEAMKMENEIRSRVEGTVEQIDVRPGVAVEKDELLMTIKPPEAA